MHLCCVCKESSEHAQCLPTKHSVPVRMACGPDACRDVTLVSHCYELVQKCSQLFRSITQDSYPAIAGDYSTWVPPYSYAIMAKLEENVGYVVDGVCLRNTTLKQLLVCPEGQESLPAGQLADHCQRLGIPCPEVCTCLFPARPRCHTGTCSVQTTMFDAMVPFLAPPPTPPLKPMGLCHNPCFGWSHVWLS